MHTNDLIIWFIKEIRIVLNGFIYCIALSAARSMLLFKEGLKIINIFTKSHEILHCMRYNINHHKTGYCNSQCLISVFVKLSPVQ